MLYGVLHAAVDGTLDARLLQPLCDLVMDRSHEAVILRSLFLQGLDDLPGSRWGPGTSGSDPPAPTSSSAFPGGGQGGVDLHGLQRFLLLLLRGLILHGAHIVEPVGHLDEDDPDILAHGQEHLAQILHLLLGLGCGLNAGQLADPSTISAMVGGKGSGYILMGGVGILDGVMEQSGGNGLESRCSSCATICATARDG